MKKPPKVQKFECPTLGRLRNEEIKRLEEEDRKEDEEAAKSANV